MLLLRRWLNRARDRALVTKYFHRFEKRVRGVCPHTPQPLAHLKRLFTERGLGRPDWQFADFICDPNRQQLLAGDPQRAQTRKWLFGNLHWFQHHQEEATNRLLHAAAKRLEQLQPPSPLAVVGDTTGTINAWDCQGYYLCYNQHIRWAYCRRQLSSCSALHPLYGTPDWQAERPHPGSGPLPKYLLGCSPAVARQNEHLYLRRLPANISTLSFDPEDIVSLGRHDSSDREVSSHSAGASSPRAATSPNRSDNRATRSPSASPNPSRSGATSSTPATPECSRSTTSGSACAPPRAGSNSHPPTLATQEAAANLLAALHALAAPAAANPRTVAAAPAPAPAPGTTLAITTAAQQLLAGLTGTANAAAPATAEPPVPTSGTPPAKQPLANPPEDPEGADERPAKRRKFGSGIAGQNSNYRGWVPHRTLYAHCLKECGVTELTDEDAQFHRNWEVVVTALTAGLAQAMKNAIQYELALNRNPNQGN